MTHDPLIATALLGTARMAVVPPPPDVSLESTWAAISIEDPADAVLQALALTRAMHHGGTKLQTENAPVPACAPESQELLSAGAVDALMRLLKGEFSEVLSEWLGFASTAGGVLPGRVLPELLAAATKDHSLRHLTRKLAGERGIWIAGRHQKFSWIIEGQSVEENSWEEGSPAERIAWLRQTRTTDPSRAMEAVTSHWSGEEVTMRESILRVISENPLPSDEAWLEQHALTDRRQEVRDLAAVSLASLPDSAFRKRALGRIGTHVKIQRRLLKRTIVIEPPKSFEPSWAADGIKEKPPQGTGEKAWWLRQIAGMIPLADWPALLGCDAGELFGFPVDRDWQDPILFGWIDAGRRFPDRALSERFVPFLATLDPWPAVATHRFAVLSAMLDAIPAERRFHLLDAIVGKLPVETAVELLARCREAPPSGVGKTVLAVIDSALVSKPTVFHRQQARALALCIPQEGIQARLELLAKLPELTPAAEEFATTLEFRRSLPTHFKTP